MTTISLLKNGVEAFLAMCAAIDSARACVALEMYIFADDETGREFRSHLIAAARRRVQVMGLLDAWGSWALSNSFWDEFRDAGGMLRWFRPIRKGMLPFRNHRKLLLIDRHQAFIGGLNIANEYRGGSDGDLPWRDNVLEIGGEEVERLRRSFLRMWSRAVLPLRNLVKRIPGGRRQKIRTGTRVRFFESGPEDAVQPVRRAYRQLVRRARISIDLAMSYFYPPGRIMRELKRAVRRGVRVRLLFPRKNDVPIALWAARGLYGRLLRAGMEVWEYLPGMLHSKLAIADDTVIAGSANMDIRSGKINYEMVVVVTDTDLATKAKADFTADLKQAEQIRLDDWKNRPCTEKLKERVSYWLLARADVFISRMEIMRKYR
ncbi:MAG: hypothetical protein A2072_04110 [Nitrospirae bacterium GWC1_57_7]|nr:MAG: hypothetical protein A2072_04110 [Nitrospirae bacterium GWC1_57_7]